MLSSVSPFLFLLYLICRPVASALVDESIFLDQLLQAGDGGAKLVESLSLPAEKRVERREFDLVEEREGVSCARSFGLVSNRSFEAKEVIFGEPIYDKYPLVGSEGMLAADDLRLLDALDIDPVSSAGCRCVAHAPSIIDQDHHFAIELASTREKTTKFMALRSDDDESSILEKKKEKLFAERRSFIDKLTADASGKAHGVLHPPRKMTDIAIRNAPDHHWLSAVYENSTRRTCRHTSRDIVWSFLFSDVSHLSNRCDRPNTELHLWWNSKGKRRPVRLRTPQLERHLIVSF